MQKGRNEGEEAENRTLESTKERPETIKSASREKNRTYQNVFDLPYPFSLHWLIEYDVGDVGAVLPVTEARLVNTLASTSLASRSRVISALGTYNQKYGIVENEYD